ncbi:chromate transporter [Paenibacillus eucommiae]|uniref:Chromate transporter n=1 Tax=Paenibacillus eucommiae TaxID=1355755 RepID=A0ABS4IWT8_9BACL|nr:chromate transporter [Paenibacillus eucommiae]MBP1991978.1 chromate transporter [Paenibacillus eucommiae]
MISQLRARISILAQIFWVFFRIGPSSFGGGYAMIPLIEREVVQKRKWMEQSEISELVLIAGSAPGGVGVNSAVFIGHHKAGVAGACMAVLGITLPTFVIVFLLSIFNHYFEHNHKIAAALKGIHGAIVALILIAGYKMAKTSLLDKTTIAIVIAALGLLLLTSIHPITVLASGLVGILLVKVKELLGLKVQMEKTPEPSSEQQLVFPEYYI